MKNGELSDLPDRRSIQWRNEEHFNCFFFLQYSKQMPREKREFHLVGRHDLLSPSSLPIEKCDTHTQGMDQVKSLVETHNSRSIPSQSTSKLYNIVKKRLPTKEMEGSLFFSSS
jgi:hypothetical protein